MQNPNAVYNMSSTPEFPREESTAVEEKLMVNRDRVVRATGANRYCRRARRMIFLRTKPAWPMRDHENIHAWPCSSTRSVRFMIRRILVARVRNARWSHCYPDVYSNRGSQITEHFYFASFVDRTRSRHVVSTANRNILGRSGATRISEPVEITYSHSSIRSKLFLFFSPMLTTHFSLNALLDYFAL